MLEQEWGRIKQVDNVDEVFEKEEPRPTLSIPNSLPENDESNENSVLDLSQLKGSIRTKDLLQTMKEEEKDYLMKLRAWKSRQQQSQLSSKSNPQMPSIVHKQESPPGFPYPAIKPEAKSETEMANTFKSVDGLNVLATAAAEMSAIANDHERLVMTDEEMNEEINQAINARGRETRIAGFYDEDKVKQSEYAPKPTRRKAKSSPTKAKPPPKALARPKMGRQHTIRKYDFGNNEARSIRTRCVWLWGTDIDYVTYEASKYYTPQTFDGGIETFKWGPSSRIGDDKHDGTGQKWWDTYNQQKYVVIEDLEADTLPISMLIDLIGDREFHLTRRGLPAGKQFNSRLMVITSKQEPNALYSAKGSESQRLTLRQRLLEKGNLSKFIYNPLH